MKMQVPMSEIFDPEEHEGELEEVTEVLEPEAEAARAQVPEEKPTPPGEVAADAKSPEEMRTKLREIMGVPLNRQNIRNGVILSVILERPTPRRLRNQVNRSEKPTSS